MNLDPLDHQVRTMRPHTLQSSAHHRTHHASSARQDLLVHLDLMVQVVALDQMEILDSQVNLEGKENLDPLVHLEMPEHLELLAKTASLVLQGRMVNVGVESLEHQDQLVLLENLENLDQTDNPDKMDRQDRKDLLDKLALQEAQETMVNPEFQEVVDCQDTMPPTVHVLHVQLYSCQDSSTSHPPHLVSPPSSPPNVVFISLHSRKQSSCRGRQLHNKVCR